MAGSGISDDRQLSKSPRHHCNVGAAPSIEKGATNSACILDRNELSKKYPRICQGIPNLNAITLQNKLRVLKGNGSQDRNSSRLSMNRPCTEQNKPRDCITLEGNLEDKPHEEEVSTGSCRCTYLTDSILDREEGQFNVGRKPLGKCIKQDLSRRIMDTVNLKTSPSLNGENPDKCNTKDWSPPKGFWKVFGMENVAAISSAERFDDVILPEEAWNINESEISSGRHRNDSGLKSLSKGLPKAHVLDSSATKGGEWSVENAHKLGHFGGLWRTDSWESVSSNANLFSLSERVELNRTNLKRMLTSSPRQRGPGVGFESLPQQSLAPASCQFQSNPLNDSFPRNKYTKQGCRIHQNDSDWNSGISLQGSGRGMRAFVSSNQLPLSPRHELAKLLLERARMKARASPLKADHSILPMVKSSADISTNGISSPKKDPFSMEECLSSAQNSCNLSNSPGGESHGGPHKKRTQSPSHVRFEDESTLEAAVRYQLRRKGGLESSVQCIPGTLLQKPGLPSDRIPGKEHMLGAESGNLSEPFHRDTEVIGNWSWKSGVNPLATGKAGERTFGKAKVAHFNAALCIDGKCSCCGSYIISAAKAISLDPPSYEFPDASTLHKGREPQKPSHHKLPASSAMEVGTNLGVEAPDVGVFASRIVPCWVLPSQHRIKIEPIKETYIGEITSIDDVSVTEGNAANTVFQEMKDCREPKIPTCCCAIMPKVKDSSASSIELNAIGIGKSTGCTGENKEPGSIVEEDKSKSRRTPTERQGEGHQRTHRQLRSIRESRDWADWPVASVSTSKHSHEPREQVAEVSPISTQLYPSSFPVMKPVQSSNQNRENPILYCSQLPQQKSTSSLQIGQVKKIPSLNFQSRFRVPTSHLMNTSLPTEFEGNTLGQDTLPKRPMINEDHMTLLANSQQNKRVVTKDSSSIHLDACPPQYRLVHLNPEENDGRSSDSKVFAERPLLQPQQSPSGPDQQLPNDHTAITPVPSYNCPLSSAVQQLSGDKHSSEGHRLEDGEKSAMAKQLTGTRDGLLSSVHKASIKLTRRQSCLFVESSANVSSSMQSSEKQKDKAESQPAAVKTQPQDITWEPLTPIPPLVQDGDSSLSKPTQPGASDWEPLLPGTRTANCRGRPIQQPASKPSDDNQLPLSSVGSSGSQHITESRPKSRSFMKAFLATIGHHTVSKLNRLRSSSMEQINSHSAKEKSWELQCEKIRANLRKTPSLQSLQLVSLLAQLRKATSMHLFHAQSKKNRRSLYLVGEMMETGLGSSGSQTTGCRSLTPLSVEDIGLPSHPRFIGHVMETFADASFLLQLSKPAHGPFGFLISRSHGGIFIHEMADKNAEKLYSGLLEPGDEILEVNGQSVDGLSFTEVNSLMFQGNTVSVMVRRHNPSIQEGH